ncbi:putative sulfate exporter family transporter [Psychromonas sp. RZ22]|uniref:YeiH family protein n=1 Tax=Psychromonas algarum TaxID=2555643 RepID=UPI0010684962|nr:putative sulfate exporter family transporter [Psychromonas sp. RZ22]TEW54636.1 putative sulfate exporter family transporter [Psychromonas sp. RZ22]
MTTTITKASLTKNHIIFIVLGVLCLSPIISSPIALVLGFTIATLGLVPAEINTGKLTKKLLALSIVGLGFGINVDQAVQASSGNLGLIVGSIFMTLFMGTVLTRLFKIDCKMGHLIASGTAICGGSAIAAVAPAIQANNEQTSHALATVFILNSIALFVFPLIGHALGMSQYNFGLWSAIAIHDTSSVVGAASAYGDEALQIATTVKLARALWIIPVAFISALVFKGDSKKVTIPMFIIYYCVAIAIAHFLPQFHALYTGLFFISKRLLVLCLFLIGCGITIQAIKSAGYKPMLLGVLLWITVASVVLAYIELF